MNPDLLAHVVKNADPVPFHKSIIDTLQRLGTGNLFDTSEPYIGLKALLALIAATDIPENHNEIREAIHQTMLRVAPLDMDLMTLYDKAIINLLFQQVFSAHRAKQKAEEDHARMNEREQEDRQRAEVNRRETELREKAEELEFRENMVRAKESSLLQKKKTRKK